MDGLGLKHGGVESEHRTGLGATERSPAQDRTEANRSPPHRPSGQPLGGSTTEPKLPFPGKGLLTSNGDP